MNENKKQTVKCVFGNKAVPVTLEPDGDLTWVAFPFHREMIDEIKAMKGAQWRKELKLWTISNCKRNFYAFRLLANDSAIVKQYFSGEQHFPVEGVWKHQQEMVDFILSHRRVLLGAEMRTGKTRPTIQSFLMSEHKVCWFVTTKSAFSGIFRESRKWFADRVQAFEYGQAGYVKQDCKVIYIMTYDKFTSVVKEWPAGRTPPGFIVFDECQKLKTPSSQRTEMAMKLVYDLVEPTYQGREYVVGLSGTPSPKNPVDWWSQCEVIRAGFVREGDQKKMEWRIGTHEQTGAAGEFWKLSGWKEGEVHKLYLRLSGLVKIWLLRDCIELPAKRYEVVELTPSEELLRVAQFIVDTEDNASVIRTKLRQLSDGFQYESEYNAERNEMVRVGMTYVGSPKEIALKADLEEHEDDGRLVVYSAFQGSVDVITKICLSHGWHVLQMDGRGRFLFDPSRSKISTTEAIELALGEMDRSSDTKQIEKLIVNAQTDAAGTGLEFSASRTIIYYSNSDSGEGRMQSEARGYSANMDKVRGGLIKDYCHLPSDYLVRQHLLEKKDLQSISMGAMKELFQKGG